MQNTAKPNIIRSWTKKKLKKKHQIKLPPTIFVRDHGDGNGGEETEGDGALEGGLSPSPRVRLLRRSTAAST